MAVRVDGAASGPCVVVYTLRDRTRTLARAAFPRRRGRVLFARTPPEFAAAFRSTLVDAALVDLAAPSEDAWRVAAFAREFPSAPFFAVTPLRAGDGPVVAQCASLDFADVIAEGIDDGIVRDLVQAQGFSARFADALQEPPEPLTLPTEMQRRTWRSLVSYAGRTVRTEVLARDVGVTREHLSRTFAAGGAPNLKRVIDLVRLLSAAELAKNPGFDVRDVAHVLGFASSSHLSSTSQRVVGTRPVSLARLRTVDLIERFVKGRGRSRDA